MGVVGGRVRILHRREFQLLRKVQIHLGRKHPRQIDSGRGMWAHATILEGGESYELTDTSVETSTLKR